jgi:hypothetical protein
MGRGIFCEGVMARPLMGGVGLQDRAAIGRGPTGDVEVA